MLQASCTAAGSHAANLDAIKASGYSYDQYTTPAGRSVTVVSIKHGSVAFDIDGFMVYVDPVTIFGDSLTNLPKADLILVTHEHHDHLDPIAVERLTKDSTVVMTSEAVAAMLPGARPLKVGQTADIVPGCISLQTTPAYNITPGHENFHPEARGDLGYLLRIDGFTIYVAGDTEDIPPMARLADENIDIAFLPVNQPYTMTPTQAIHAIEMIKPAIVYPYHYGDTDLTPILDRFPAGDTPGSAPRILIRPLQ